MPDMSKYQWISLLGVWVMVFLFLGFPAPWDKGVAIASGLLIIAIAYRGGVAMRASINPVPPTSPTQPTSAATTPNAPSAQDKESI
jgi:hypothetical protein